jgi:WD repeat-containing protein 19
MNKFQECLFPAERLKSQELYECLGRQCLQNIELKIAYMCFQKSSNLSMVMIIEKIMNETEKNVILGHIAMILGQYDLANDFYLKSSMPIYALEMRCDIQDWLIALNLAKTIAPDRESIICRKLGQ